MTEIMEALKILTTEQLIEAFELTNDNTDENIPFARDIIMTELESRDSVSFENWMLSDDMNKIDFPSLFF